MTIKTEIGVLQLLPTGPQRWLANHQDRRRTSPMVFGGVWRCWHINFLLLLVVSRIARQHVAVVWRHQLVVPCGGHSLGTLMQWGRQSRSARWNSTCVLGSVSWPLQDFVSLLENGACLTCLARVTRGLSEVHRVNHWKCLADSKCSISINSQNNYLMSLRMSLFLQPLQTLARGPDT